MHEVIPNYGKIIFIKSRFDSREIHLNISISEHINQLVAAIGVSTLLTLFSVFMFTDWLN